MTDLPPEAITAAAEAIRAELKASREVEPDALARAALEAAAPAVRAPGQAEIAKLRERLEAAWKQLDEEAAQRISGYLGMRESVSAVARANGAAEERERIRLLAERHAAVYAECGGCCDPEDNPDHRKPFADLIGDAS